MKTKQLVPIVSVLLLLSITLKAQIGLPDPSFSNDGIVTQDFGFQDNLNDVKIQTDQKIVSTGVALDANYMGTLKVIRLLADGTPDSSFAVNGVFSYVITSETYGYESAIRPDGKIVVAGLAAVTFGYYDLLLLRLKPDGIIDSTFGTNGSTVTSFSVRDDLAHAVALQADGKIIVAGSITDTINYYNNPSIVRFTENGFVDSTFGSNGVVTLSAIDIDNDFSSVMIQPDGKILASGHYSQPFFGNMDFDFLVMRVDTNGLPDPSFGNNGVAIQSVGGGIDEALGMAMDTSKNIYLSGFTTGATIDMALLKYDNNGILIPVFGNAGIVTFNNSDEDVAYDIKIQPDQKIVLGGNSGLGFGSNDSMALWRYLPNGNPDNGFGHLGFATHAFASGIQNMNSIALQQDGKIVGAGKSNNGLNNDIAVMRFAINELSSVGELAAANKISVFPNPVKAGRTITISFENPVAIPLQLQLMDEMGNKIKSFEINAENIKNNNLQIIIPANLKIGLYYLSIADGQQILNKKLVVR